MLNIAFNEHLPDSNVWHFIPATLISSQQTSIPNAKISNYFASGIKQQPKLTATLHGNLLQGVKTEQKDLFKAVCYLSEENPNNIEVVISEKIVSTVDWRKDICWQSFEGPLGTIKKHNLIQQALHEE